MSNVEPAPNGLDAAVFSLSAARATRGAARRARRARHRADDEQRDDAERDRARVVLLAVRVRVAHDARLRELDDGRDEQAEQRRAAGELERRLDERRRGET